MVDMYRNKNIAMYIEKHGELYNLDVALLSLR